MGRPTLGLSAQAPWGYQVVGPWDALASSLTYIKAQLPRPMSYVEGLNLVCVVGFAGLLVAVARRLPVSHTLYSVPSLVLASTRAMFMMPLMSASRLVLAIYPAFLWLGAWLWRHPRLAFVWLIVGAIAQLILVQWFARWGFVA
jgi:hypothetical protein